MPGTFSVVLGSSVQEGVHPGGSVFAQRGTKSLFVSRNLRSKNRFKVRLGAIEAVPDPLAAGANLASELGIQVIETGVPFLEQISALKTADAISVSFRAIVETLGWSAGAAIFLFLISRWARSNSDVSNHHEEVGVVQSFVLASLRPAMLYVPVQASIKATTIILSMLQVMARRNDGNIINAIMKQLGCTQEVLPMLKTMNQVVQDISEVVFILFLGWLLIRMKDIVIAKVQLNIQIEKRGESSGIIRLLESIKSLTSIAVWSLCTIAALMECGVNAAPLLTSLGASSIIVGLAAQPLLSNIVSGIAIFTSRAFVVGDHIELISAGGSKVIEGTVEVVSPLTCVLRDKDDALIYINNGQLTSLLLRNKSQTVVVL